MRESALVAMAAFALFGCLTVALVVAWREVGMPSLTDVVMSLEDTL